MKTYNVTIKFTAKESHMALVKGTVETEDGWIQSFKDDAELHRAIDNVTERELRQV